MPHFWFKVYSAERDENRILWMDVPPHQENHVYSQLKKDVNISPNKHSFFINNE